MRGVQLILNTGHSVDVIGMDNQTAHSRDLRPVPNGSVLEAARQLAKPLSRTVEVSPRAAAILQQIMQDKEILAMARVAVASKATAAAPAAAAPAARPVLVNKGATKAAAPAKAATTTTKKATAAKANGAAGVARPRYAGHKIKVLNKEHGAREGTKRQQGMDIILKSKTTDEALPKLEAIGADPSFIRFAIEHGLVELV